ncbi:MAG: I78 family peptidase inhibitor [Rhodobacterales bacterium]
MPSLRTLIGGGLLLALAACMPEMPEEAGTAPNACGASGLQGLVGQPVAQQDFSGVGAARRVMPEGSAMTMDYREDRLNVTYDRSGRITRIWCG